jgi:hypothetical protein
MARTSYANILALPDSAQVWNFDLFFPSIPGGASATSMTYRCKTSTLPSSKIEPLKIELHGAAKQEAGRATYDHSFTAKFQETVDYATMSAFRKWRASMRDWKNNTGTDSAAYKVNLELDVYDNGGNVTRTIILAGAFPTDIAEIEYNGAGAEAVEISMTFSFDYLDDGETW